MTGQRCWARYRWTLAYLCVMTTLTFLAVIFDWRVG